MPWHKSQLMLEKNPKSPFWSPRCGASQPAAIFGSRGSPPRSWPGRWRSSPSAPGSAARRGPRTPRGGGVGARRRGCRQRPGRRCWLCWEPNGPWKPPKGKRWIFGNEKVQAFRRGFWCFWVDSLGCDSFFEVRWMDRFSHKDWTDMQR